MLNSRKEKRKTNCTTTKYNFCVIYRVFLLIFLSQNAPSSLQILLQILGSRRSNDTYVIYVYRETCDSMESTFIYNFTCLHIINRDIVLLWLISPSNSKTLEVDIYHFAIQKRNIHTTPPLDYAILLRLSVTQDFALAYLHKAKNFFEDYGHNLLQSKWIALYDTPPRMVQKYNSKHSSK